MPGNSSRKGAIKKTGKGNPTAGSGGRVRRGLEGKGPTPKASERPYHRAYKAKKKAAKEAAVRPKRRPKSGDAEWIAGRNSVVEALRAGMPVNSVYVAEGAERDGRLREVFATAAERGVSLLEVPRPELDRMTAGAVHQGLAARVPAYEYAHPDDLLALAEERARAATDHRPRLGHRPAQPGRRGAFRGGIRRPRRGRPRAAGSRHDGRGLEDLGRSRRAGAGRADREPHPAAEGLPAGWLHGGGPCRRR